MTVGSASAWASGGAASQRTTVCPWFRILSSPFDLSINRLLLLLYTRRMGGIYMSQSAESGAEPAYSKPYEICEFCGFVIIKTESSTKPIMGGGIYYESRRSSR